MSTENKLKDCVPEIGGALVEAEAARANRDALVPASGAPPSDMEGVALKRVALTEEEQRRAGPLAKEIASELGETSPTAARVLLKLISTWGPQFAQDHLAKARDVEAAGGLLTETTQQRRTFGGVFFRLVKNTVGTEAWHAFAEKSPRPVNRRPKKPPPPPPPRGSALPLTFEEACAAALSASAQPGQGQNVKLSLAGQVGRVEKRESCTVISITIEKVPNLPRGLPAPPKVPTRYTVFISKKHWAKIEVALANDSTDPVLVEGFPAYVKDFGGIAVYAFSAMTMQMKRDATPRPALDDSSDSEPSSTAGD